MDCFKIDEVDEVDACDPAGLWVRVPIFFLTFNGSHWESRFKHSLALYVEDLSRACQRLETKSMFLGSEENDRCLTWSTQLRLVGLLPVRISFYTLLRSPVLAVFFLRAMGDPFTITILLLPAEAQTVALSSINALNILNINIVLSHSLTSYHVLNVLNVHTSPFSL